MTTTIRTFQPGDDVAQVSIYNEAASGLPKFKPATLDEVRRRLRDPRFDPTTRFFALTDGKPVGYVTIAPGGRVSYPWCRKGHDGVADALFAHALAELKRRGERRAFAAYRGDWTGVRDFLLRHGFSQSRQMVNFVMDLVEMPTPAARTSSLITPVTPEDVPTILELGRGVLRLTDEAGLRQHLFDNLYFPPSSLFAVRGKQGGPPLAVGIVVTSEAFADPNAVDASMPCFRLGAWGTEGLTHKRINGLFSVLAADDRDLNVHALDLLGHTVRKLEDTNVATLAAQVPSDVGHLHRFYKHLFRLQGSFPLYERDL